MAVEADAEQLQIQTAGGGQRVIEFGGIGRIREVGLAFRKVPFRQETVEEVVVHVLPIAQRMVVGDACMVVRRVFIQIPRLEARKINMIVVKFLSENTIQFDHRIAGGETEIERFAFGQFGDDGVIDDFRAARAHRVIICNFFDFHYRITTFPFSADSNMPNATFMASIACLAPASGAWPFSMPSMMAAISRTYMSPSTFS